MTMVLEPVRTAAEADGAIRIVLAGGGRCEGLLQALDCLFAEVSFVEADTLAAVGRMLASPQPPDLVLVDIALPQIGGFPGLLYLRAQNAEVPIAVVCCDAAGTVMRRAVAVGAAGFVAPDSDAETLREAIRAMLEGEIWTPELAGPETEAAIEPAVAELLRRLGTLTPQQLRVLTMLAQGLLNKQVAYELSVSEATVKAHVSAVLQKLGVEGRVQAVAAVCRLEGGCFTRELAPR